MTTYYEGEDFNPEGMVVKVVYSKLVKEVTEDYSILDGEGLTEDQTAVTISYSENGVTKTVKQKITVKPVVVHPSLQEKSKRDGKQKITVTVPDDELEQENPTLVHPSLQGQEKRGTKQKTTIPRKIS